MGSSFLIGQRIDSNGSIHTCHGIHWTLRHGPLFNQMVPIHIEFIIAKRYPRASFHSRPCSVCKHLRFFWGHQEATPKNLPSVVDCQVHMLASLPFAMQPDEALGAEEVDAVLTKHGCVVVLALEADQTVDDTLQVVSQVWTSSIPGVHMHETFIGIEKTTLHALASSHPIFESSTHQLLDIGCDVCTSLASSMRAVEAILTKEIFALLALQDSSSVFAFLTHYHCRGLSYDIYLILLLAYLPQKLNRIFQILNDAAQVQLFFHVSLNSLLHDPEQKELLRAVYAENPCQTLNDFGSCWRQAFRRASHH
mmetsp:Transcript_105583/g.147195  ORF Transcript_105583/g.147195 Transcript_105583/m.147195 type:complete len:309 (+) Transcript_105583:148-1074(+)